MTGSFVNDIDAELVMRRQMRRINELELRVTTLAAALSAAEMRLGERLDNVEMAVWGGEGRG